LHLDVPSNDHHKPELLLERHGPGRLRFCNARLRRAQGEDASQEALLAARRRSTHDCH
jgi:DNA-directed RNA polymerase specialized sigma24 family protein